MTILTKPWRIDRRGERIYVDAPGEVCVDVCSGTSEDRARVMALLEQAQRAMRLLRSEMVLGDDGLMHDEIRCPILVGGECAEWCAEKRTLLRAAGVLDE